MNTKFLPSFLCLLVTVLSTHAAEPNTAPPRTFSHPDRIRYDSQCFTIDGKDVFIYSGAFHYFRCPKELWRDRFQKIKDAGFNAVETYAAWNWSEPEMPKGTNDFSKVNVSDLDEWLTMAEQFGFYTIVRPGPYICAEWATGGFPQWLLTKKPEHPLRTEWLRSDDPVFLAWSKHWYDAVCPVIAKHQITRKAPGQPGVILMQIENEYDFSPALPDEAKINHIKALAQYAQADGIDVPLFTCWTHQVRGSRDPVLRQIYDACNFYPRWNVANELRDGIGKLRAEQPDAPLTTTELQGGWFAQVGGQLSEQQDGVNAPQIQNITLFAIQNGDTLMNYYMLFGGSNLGDWAARDLLTSYDYNAPIREWGGVDARYQRVWALGHMLREHGTRLARAQAVECEAKTTQKDVTVAERRAPDGSRYFFVRTSEHTAPREGTATVREKASDAEINFNYKLEPFGSMIFYLPPGATDTAQGEWLPKPAPAIERPTDLPSGVTLTSAKTRTDPGPSRWQNLRPEETLIQAGDYGSQFVFYRAKIRSRTGTNLLVKFRDGDAIIAAINGRPAPRASGSPNRSVFALPAGVSDVELLYENHGYANFGKDVDRLGGITSGQLTSAGLLAGNALVGWKMRLVDGTEQRPEVNPDFDDTDWKPVDVKEARQLRPHRTAVFRTKVVLTADNLSQSKLNLNLGRVDDEGWVYVNGKSVGQTTDWTREYSFDVSSQLQPGTNVIAIIVRNTDGDGGLAEPTLGQQPQGANVQFSLGYPTGDDAKWWKPNLRDKNWTVIPIGADSPQADDPLNWYRMNFELSSPNPHVWVPWHLHLEAAGNGFLYLNGHAIGRYWEAGPQHDFFLPECWLNFGPGKPNVIALSLRPGEKGAALHAAAVEPYRDFAENR